MKKITDYLKSVWLELQKVDFPSKKQTWEMTTLVVVVSVLIAVFVSGLDFGFSKLVQWLITS